MNPDGYQNLSAFRVTKGLMQSSEAHGNNGCWVLDHMGRDEAIRIIASDRGGWDHVSVSLKNRIPTWDEMCYVKRLFWLPEETVMQLHPPEMIYINNHNNVLHLWRPQYQEIPLPPIVMV